MITTELERLRAEALASLEQAETLEALKEWRVAYLGRRGRLTQILRQVGTLPPDERPRVGAVANRIKDELEAAYEAREAALKEAVLAATLAAERVDVTLPGRPADLGGYHPTTLILREITSAFARLGFQVVEGPEVEWDYYNFEALNIPRDHPARDMWSSFWLTPGGSEAERPMLLRTHTSPMQIRVMEKFRPPIRVIVPGRCYRYEATDATHESMFYQFEGLAVDEGLTFAELKGTLYAFARMVFGPERRVRFRCDYFPFVEPGCDMSIDCFHCGGQGCRVCGGTGWIEIMGAGMVHPQVLRNVGLDPERYQGFAFGGGPERIAMLKYGIEDIRHFYANDLRFLRQFRW